MLHIYVENRETLRAKKSTEEARTGAEIKKNPR